MQEIVYKNLNTSFGIKEEAKKLRARILFKDENIKTVMFTSCIVSEGKIKIAFEMTKSFAELGKKSILIGADLRTPAIYNKYIDGNISIGLTDYLTGQCELDDIIYKNVSGDGAAGKEFYYIPPGTISDNPSELFSSDVFRFMLIKLREIFDVIVIDTPPMEKVVDATVIAPLTDGVVEVIESGKVNYKLAQDLNETLKASDCRILGVILDKVDKSKKGYHHFKYSK